MSNGLTIDDPEDWLIVSPNEVDDILARYAPQQDLKEPRASQIFEDLSQFLTEKSSIEGIESQPRALMPVRLDPKRFAAILSRDPLLEKVFLQMDIELAQKSNDHIQDVAPHRAVAKDLLHSIKLQREARVDGPGKSLLRFVESTFATK